MKELKERTYEEKAVQEVLDNKSPRNPYEESLYEMLYSRYKLIPSTSEENEVKYDPLHLRNGGMKSEDKNKNKKSNNSLKGKEFVNKSQLLLM